MPEWLQKKALGFASWFALADEEGIVKIERPRRQHSFLRILFHPGYKNVPEFLPLLWVVGSEEVWAVVRNQD